MGAQSFLFTECSHPHTQVVPEKRGPHYAKLICTDCKRFLRWMPSPETIKRREENARILTMLAKSDGLSEWERQFVRDMSSHKNISPKQQALLYQLRDKYGGKPD